MLACVYNYVFMITFNIHSKKFQLPGPFAVSSTHHLGSQMIGMQNKYIQLRILLQQIILIKIL